MQDTMREIGFRFVRIALPCERQDAATARERNSSPEDAATASRAPVLEGDVTRHNKKQKTA